MSERTEVREITSPLWDEFMDGVLSLEDEIETSRQEDREGERIDDFQSWLENECEW